MFLFFLFWGVGPICHCHRGVLSGREGSRVWALGAGLTGEARLGTRAGAGAPTVLWAAGERRPEVEEALWLLDGHHTVTRVLTKLTKLSVPVNLVGPQVSPTIWWVPASRGYSFFWA